MYFDKVLILVLVLVLWYYSPNLCKEILGNDLKKKKRNEPFSTDWSSNVYGGQMPWNGWNY
jgi:hypothetical protein